MIDLSQEEVDEFIEIWRIECKEILTDAEARFEACWLLEFYYWINTQKWPNGQRYYTLPRPTDEMYRRRRGSVQS